MKFTEEPSNGSSGASKYLRISDGDIVYCILKGDIQTSYQKWNGTTYEPAKKGEQGASLRFKVNAIIFEDKKLIAKILEGGGHLYFDLKNINEEFPLETTMIKITRTGVKQNTRFTVSVAGPKAQPDEKTMKAIEAVKLHPLESTKGQADVGNDLPSFNDDEDIPF